MVTKWIDRGKDAPSTMLTPRTLALAQAQAEEFRKRAEAAEAARDVILTEAQAVELLRQLVADAGSQLALADGDYSMQGMISNVLKGNRPPTMPEILDLLGLEIVFRVKTGHT